MNLGNLTPSEQYYMNAFDKAIAEDRKAEEKIATVASVPQNYQVKREA